MKFVTDLEKGILGRQDNIEMWSELISQVPKKILKNKDVKILCPAIGHGTETDILVKRLKALGQTNQEINSRIYLVDKYKVFTNAAKRKGYKNVKQADFLDMKTDMNKLKNCVVLMNAPYQKTKWFKFVKKTIELQPRLIATINPDPTSNKTTFGDKWRAICRENGLVHRKDVTNYFPEVSSGRISGFILDTTKPFDQELFKSEDPIYDSILEKTTTDEPDSIVIRGSQSVNGNGDDNKSHTISETKDKDHPYPSVMNCGKEGLTIKYSNKKEEYRKHKDWLNGRVVVVNRFYGRNNPDPVFEVDNIENYNIGGNVLVYKIHNGETIENFTSVYASKPYRYVMKRMRNGGFDIQAGHFMRFKRLDLTKTWTDKEIYKALNFTKEERERVESDS